MNLNVEKNIYDSGGDSLKNYGSSRLSNLNNALWIADLQRYATQFIDEQEGKPFDEKFLARRLETACLDLSKIYDLPEVPKFEITNISEDGVVNISIIPEVKKIEVSFYVAKNADTRRLIKRSLFNSNKNKKVYRMRWFKN